MATPSQAQLVEERDSIRQEIEMLKAARQELIDKGKLNSAKEYDSSIAAAQATERSLSNKITNYTTFSAERAAQDAEIASTKDFESRSNPANQKVTSTSTTVSETVSGGGSSTISGTAPTVTADEAAAAKLANQRASAFTANPNGRFGTNTINNAVASGAITAEEAEKLKAGQISEEQRWATAQQARATSTATVGTETPSVASSQPGNPLTTTTTVEPVAKPEQTVPASSDPAAKQADSQGGSASVTVNPDGTDTVTPAVENPISTPPTVTSESDITDQATEDQQIEGEVRSSPEEIDAESDPEAALAEESRQDAEDRLNESYIQDQKTAEDEAVAELDEQSRLEAEERLNDAYANDETTNVAGSVDQVRSTGVAQTQRNARQQEDWRVRLQLAPQSTYLYNDPAIKQGDLLYPLKATSGVVFPYSPQISTSYKANYDPSDIAHTNYKQYFYKNSSVDDVQIIADFTAQDTTEALYVLAVIHFFRSVTKMFYGQDANPRAGTPPPLCYLFGYGQYQFSDHPLLITGFQYSLPNDVDYIRAGSTTQWAGQNVSSYAAKSGVSNSTTSRLFSSGLTVGGITPEPTFNGLSNSQATYVPTKLQITLNAVPIVTRSNIANEFSVKKYATGELLKKGIW